MLGEKLQEWQKSIESGGKGLFVFFVWTFIGTVVGLVVGTVGIVFHMTLDWAAKFRTAHPVVIYVLPIAGLLIILLYHLLHMEKDKGTNFILSAVRSNEAITLRTTPLIFISTVITHLFGGSAGREGAALQIGGSIASAMGREAKMNEKDERIITMCGMSAGFSALFGTPVAAVIFSMEVITVGVMHYSALVPCIVSSLVASGLAGKFGIAPTAFTLMDVPEMQLRTAWLVGILGALCAAVSVLFCLTMETVGFCYKRYFKNPYLRVFAGGCIVVILTVILGTKDYNGAGMDVITRAIGGEVKPEAFLLKIIMTALTLGAGFKGGEIVPTLFVGSTFGCFMGTVLGLPPSFSAGLGMAALFCGVSNCPMASLVLCLELFGMNGIGYFALICAVSYMLSGYYGLYTEQKIMYSKIQPKFINRNVH